MNYSNHSNKINLIKQNELSIKDNVDEFIKRIEQNKHLNAFNSVFTDDARTKAVEIEKKIKSGRYGKLAGMVIAVKDVLHLKDKPTACSSNILRNYISLYTATAVQRLINEDAIIIGKTNCDEFAMGSSNENSAFGNVLNPYDNERVPGGSSGGSAVSVAAKLCDAALGTDTGGSIRQPAALCGVYGLKPTYGRVSRYGLTAFASSFDSIGALANNIEDIALVLEVMSGKDKNDSTSSELPVPLFSNNLSLNRNKLRIGIAEEYLGEGLSHEIKNDFDSAFNEVDIILTPTTPTTAFKIGEKSSDPLEMYLSDVYTTSANLAGIPGINIPISKSSEGLPIGMQLFANQFDEEELFQMSYFIQKNIL